jgi:signal transduction histidine kinase
MDTVNSERERLRFFGRITAAATHDLKNVLAIVNENAGLLEDLCALAERGQLTPDRLTHASGRIREQVKRGDGIMRRLNDFAHSTDHDASQVDLGEAALLASGLCNRVAKLHETSIKVEAETSTSVTASRFEVIRLVCGLIEAAVKATGTSGGVSVTTQAEPPSVTVAAPEGTSVETGPLAPLAESVGAEIVSSDPHHVAVRFSGA